MLAPFVGFQIYSRVLPPAFPKSAALKQANTLLSEVLHEHLMTDAKNQNITKQRILRPKRMYEGLNQTGHLRPVANDWKESCSLQAAAYSNWISDNLCNPLCSRNIWSLRFCSWIPGAKSQQRTVHGHLRLWGTGQSFHSRLNPTLTFPFALTDLCSFCHPPERGRALCVLRGRRSRRQSGWGRLVDGPKERQHWTSSRVLPRQRVTVLWTPGLCQTSSERKPSKALLLSFLGSNTLAPFKCSFFFFFVLTVSFLKLLVHNFNV